MFSLITVPPCGRSSTAAVISALLIACGALAFASAARAEGAVAIVFDGSGSMWGRASRGSKFTTGRDALRTALASAPETTPVGLYGFGIRERGSCGRVEVPVSVADGKPADVSSALDQLNPQGRGPIAQALEEAGAALKSLPSPRSIVLIHDDSDNCQADPCSVAAALKTEMPDLVIHAVTLRETSDPPLMACLAAGTGGMIAQTLDVDEIDAATARIIKAAFARDGASAVGKSAPATDGNDRSSTGAETATGPAVPPAGLTTIKGKPGLSLAANLAVQGPRFMRPVTWTIAPASNEAETIVRIGTGAIDIDLPPGAYKATAAVGGLAVTQDLTIAKDHRTRWIADLNGADLTFTAKLGANGPTVSDAAVMLRPEGAAAATSPPPPLATTDGRPALIAAGTYVATARKGDLSETIELNVVAGAAQPVGFQLPGARIAARTVGGEGGDRRLISLYDADADPQAGARPIAQAISDRATFDVPAGNYLLVTRTDPGQVSRPISVRTGQTLEIALSLRAAKVSLASRLSADTPLLREGVGYDLQALDGPSREIRHVFEANPTVELSAGRYRIRSILLATGHATERTVDIMPGAPQTIALVHNVGQLRLRFAAANGSSLRRPRVDWEIRRGRRDGRPVWRGLGSETTAYVPAGRYAVVADGADATARDVTVKAGVTLDVTVTAPTETRE
jgi:Ca-activated chloride channel family protein